MSCSRTIVEPANVFHCYVRVTPSGFDGNEMVHHSYIWSTKNGFLFSSCSVSSSLIRLQGELVVVLDTYEESALINIVQLYTLQLEALVSRVKLLVECEVPQVIICNSTSKCAYCHVRVKNESPMVINVTTEIFGAHKSDFNVHPKTFELSSYSDQSVKVIFSPTSKERRRYWFYRWLYRNICSYSVALHNTLFF